MQDVTIDEVGNKLLNIDMNGLRVRTTFGSRAFCSREWRWENPGGRETGYNLWFIAQGEGMLRTSTAEYVLRPGDCFLLPKWEQTVAEHNPDNPLIVPFVLFECLDGRGRIWGPEDIPRLPEYRRMADFPFFDQLIQRIIDVSGRDSMEQETADLWLRAGLSEVANQDRCSVYAGLELEQSILVDGICARVREHPEKYGGVAALAREANCSVDHFIRIFKKMKNITPWEYLIRSRVEKACQLLCFSSYSISQIADQLGYSDIYSFSRQFKKRTGHTPSGYRRPT